MLGPVLGRILHAEGVVRATGLGALFRTGLGALFRVAQPPESRVCSLGFLVHGLWFRV